MTPPRCPISGKHSHPTQAAAVRMALHRSHKSGGTPLRTYPCACGAWHLTSQRKRRKWGAS